MNENANSKTLVVKLFAGPCAGKTTLAHGLGYELKIRGNHSMYYVPEAAQKLIWRNELDKIKNQYYVTSKQRDELICVCKSPNKEGVDILITDSPIELGVFYAQTEKERKFVLREAKKFDQRCASINVFIERGEEYTMMGRITPKNEALLVDKKIKQSFPINIVWRHNDGLQELVDLIEDLAVKVKNGSAINLPVINKTQTAPVEDEVEAIKP